MRLRSSNKPIVTSTGFKDIRINIWGDRYGPKPKPVLFVLLIVLAVAAIGGFYPAYTTLVVEPADETESLQDAIDDTNARIRQLTRPPAEEKIIADLEVDIEKLRSVREDIKEQSADYAGIIGIIQDTIPDGSSIDQISFKSENVSMRGDTDTLNSLFGFVRDLENREEFVKVVIKTIQDVRLAGRIPTIEEKKAGSVSVIIPQTIKTVLPKAAPQSEKIDADQLILDPIDPETGHGESGGVSFTIQPENRVSLDYEIVSGNLSEPPVTILLQGTVTFHYPIERYEWIFGDGTSREVNLKQPGPTTLTVSALHTYTREDSFDPSLEVFDNRGLQIGSNLAGQFAAPDVDFTAEVVSCEDPLTIKFKPVVESSRRISEYMWNFGGTVAETGDEQERVIHSREKEPVYTFKEPNTYEVTLTVVDATMAEGKPHSVSHNILLSGTPTADFSPERIGDEGFTVRFNNMSSPDGESTNEKDHRLIQWEWDFGDGTPRKSGTESPVHTYSGDGPYNVTLTVTESDGNCDSITKTIQATNSKYPEFYVAPGNEQLMVRFSAPKKSDDNTEYLWDFGVLDNNGDPVTSTEEAPSFTYDYPGTYYVTLSITEKLETTISEVKVNVSFLSAKLQVIGSTSTPFVIEAVTSD